jgi:hypothetical protein
MAINIPILSSLDPRGFDKAKAEFKALEKASDKTKFVLGKLAVPAAAALGGIATFGFKAANAAADLGEQVSKAGVLFGDAAGDIEKWSKGAANTINMSRTEAIAAASNFATFGKAAGITGKDLGKFSKDLVGLAADIGSFNNTNPQEVIAALGSALRGEAEPMRRFGVLLDDATLRAKAMEMGIYDGNGALTAQQKILAANKVIFEQTSAAQGDLERTADSAANRQQRLAAQMKDLNIAIGEVFLPILDAVLPLLNSLAQFAGNNATTIGILGLAFGGLSAAILVANVAIKAWNVLSVITTGLNQKLGTSFTTLQTSLGAIGLALGAAASVYMIVTSRKKDNTQATKDLAAALKLEKDAQDESIQELIRRDGNTRKAITALDKMGLSLDDLTEFVEKGTGALAVSTKELDRAREAAGVSGSEFMRLRQVMENLTGEYKDAAAAAELYNSVTSNLPTVTVPAAGRLKELADKYRETKYGTQGTSAATDELAEKLKKLRGNAKDTFNTLRTTATDALKTARNEFKAFSDSVASSLTTGLTFKTAEEAGKETGAGYIAGLKNEADKIKTFSELTNRLLAMNLSPDALQTVLAAGTDAGTLIAQELIAGGQEAITGENGINKLIETTKSAAATVGQNAASNFKQEGVTLAENLVAGISETISKFQIKLKAKNLTPKGARRMLKEFADSVTLQFAASKIDVPQLADGGVVPFRPGGTLATIGEAGPEAVIPLSRFGGGFGSTYNIEVNTGVGDPAEIGRQVVNAIVDYERRSGNGWRSS